uniref:SFRICE_008710 n=1 Tax=Spodoptera frugiperda TaxID=7108 RepID=A0A2H1VSS1_SPOFR
MWSIVSVDLKKEVVSRGELIAIYWPPIPDSVILLRNFRKTEKPDLSLGQRHSVYRMLIIKPPRPTHQTPKEFEYANLTDDRSSSWIFYGISHPSSDLSSNILCSLEVNLNRNCFVSRVGIPKFCILIHEKQAP